MSYKELKALAKGVKFNDLDYKLEELIDEMSVGCLRDYDGDDDDYFNDITTLNSLIRDEFIKHIYGDKITKKQ